MPNENQENQQSNAREFGFGIGTEWAITETALMEVQARSRKIPEMVAAIENPKSLEAYRADYLENTMTVRVRDGVAIIPITGPIFCNFNWYMYFYGGTSMQWLMKDVQAAVDNPNVSAICLKINSPGGEVLGVNETAKFIYALRAKGFPITAYVEGMMCSAALWLGVMAGDVVVDETSYVGSLGVCTSYMDDSKFMEKMGFNEINIVSSQSPYKNLPPTTDKGLKRVQDRLNYLCGIFGAAAALGRDTTLEKVFADFGQGDVLIGQQAVDAGLADRIGTQEQVLALLTKTHAPNLYKGDGAENTLPTLNFNSDLKSEPVEEDETKTPVADGSASENEEILDDQSKEEIMPDQEKEKTPAAGTETKPTANDGNGNNGITAEAFAAVEQQLKDANSKLDAAETARQKAESDAAKTLLTSEMARVAAGFNGDVAKKTTMLVTLAEKFGKDSAELADYILDQQASAAQIKESGLFAENGTNGNAASGTAAQRLSAETKKIMAEEKIDFTAANVRAAELNPNLYAEYEQEIAEK